MRINKRCKKCEHSFSLERFSKRRDSKDGLDYYCKSCRKQVNKINYEKRKSGLRFAEEPSTLLGRAILAQRGIPCVTGYSGGLPHVDLLAWGCVPIDAKMSFPQDDDPRKYGWGIRERQIDSNSLFLCMAITPERIRVFIVPQEQLRIPTRRRTSDKIPTAIRVTFGSDHFNVYAEEMLLRYENRFDLIEKAREEYKPDLYVLDDIVKGAWIYYKCRVGQNKTEA